MTEKLKKELIKNIQWLGDQIGQQVEIIDRLTTNKSNYDRHFTRTSRFIFKMTHFGVRTSGAIGMIEGSELQFEFKTDCIQRIERNGNQLEFESELDQNTSRLIQINVLPTDHPPQK